MGTRGKGVPTPLFLALHRWLYETDLFKLSSLNELRQIVETSFVECKRNETETADFEEIIDEFASIKEREVLFHLTCCVIKTRLNMLVFGRNRVFRTRATHDLR